jgi:hypothetical protein
VISRLDSRYIASTAKAKNLSNALLSNVTLVIR